PSVRVPDDFATLPEAVAAILDGHNSDSPRPSILLLTGIHRLDEPIVLTRGISIRGESPDQTIIESARNVAFQFDSEERCSLENLTVRCVAKTPPEDNVPGRPPEAALQITKGTPRFYHCIVRSEMGNGISLHGVGTSVECDQCRIEDVGSKGIFVSEHATGIFAEVVVMGAAYIGILMTTQANPLFNYCVVRNGRGNGIDARTASRGTFHRCRIYSNGYSGMEISGRANPTVTSSEITSNGHWGVNAFDSALGVFNRCFILDNGQGQVLCDAASQMSVNFDRCITDRSQMSGREKEELETSEAEKKKTEEEEKEMKKSGNPGKKSPW
ncbi:MAG: right-handed parallel beta-helix repeat-containing protein, partial [Planctomycetia bacterium]|nr:right-handed parallel beta-helix repeat-containing protein [Planctomycetia bacterium]